MKSPTPYRLIRLMFRRRRNPTRWDYLVGLFTFIFIVSGVPQRVLAAHRPGGWALAGVVVAAQGVLGWLGDVAVRVYWEGREDVH